MYVGEELCALCCFARLSLETNWTQFALSSTLALKCVHFMSPHMTLTYGNVVLSSNTDQTRPCHSNIIYPASPLGKQSMSFRELLCFAFTVTDKDQMNQGLFVEGQNERKKENYFESWVKGHQAGERDNWRYIFWQPKIASLSACNCCAQAVCTVLADVN